MSLRLSLRRRWVWARQIFPLTNLGLAIVLLGSLGFWTIGVPRWDYVLWLVGKFALALVGVGLFVALLGAMIVARAYAVWASRNARSEGARGSEPVVFEARRGFAEVLELPALAWLPLIEVGWRWDSPACFEVSLEERMGVRTERIESKTRAYAEEIRRRFVIEDGFGLARITFSRTERRVVRVLPWTGALDRAPMLRSLAGGSDLPHPHGDLSGDRVDLRRYVAGDPLRLVLWKVYARTGQLMVRTPERALAPAVRIAAYLVSTSRDEPAAAAARVAVEGGLLGEGWIFSADGAREPVQDVDGALRVIVESRAVRGTAEGDAAGFEAFLTKVTKTSEFRIVVFAPAAEGRWVDRVAYALSRMTAGSSVVVAADGIWVFDPRTSVRVVDRILRAPIEGAQDDECIPSDEELDRIVFSLRSARADVVAIDRTSGRTLRSIGALRGSAA